MDTSVPRSAKIEAVISAVCEVCEISSKEIRKKTRAEPLPTARALIAHFLYRELRMTPSEIFASISNHDYNRTAVYHYVGRKTLIEIRSPFQKELGLKAEKIKRRLG